MPRAANKSLSEPVTDDKGRRKNAAKRARRLAERKADSMPVAPEMAGPRMTREVRAPLVSPAPKGGLLEVLSNNYLLKLIVRRELASMYAGSLLGLLWSYIQPAMRFALYYMVMGFILKLHDGFPYFAMHLFTGIVVVHYFSETWNGCTRSIWMNRALVLKMRVPREIFPVASMVVAAYHTLPQVLVLVFCCLISGWHLTWMSVGAGVLGMTILFLLSMALGLIFSALNAMYRDFQNIVMTLLTFAHFIVPMMYPFARVYEAKGSHPLLYNIYVSNPLTQAVILIQQPFWYSLIENPHKRSTWCPPHSAGRCAIPVEMPPDIWVRAAISVVVCAALLWFAQRFFKQVESKFPERL